MPIQLQGGIMSKPAQAVPLLQVRGTTNASVKHVRPSKHFGATLGRRKAVSRRCRSVPSATSAAEGRTAPDLKCDFLLFDLDGTLYPGNNGYVQHIRDNAERYMHEELGIAQSEVSAVRKEALALANQTVRGLKMLGYEFDTDAFVTNMRAGEHLFLLPDAEVQEFLGSLPQRKWIFTNTGEGPARRALECLGISEHFEGVFGADFMGDISKPQVEAFQKVLDSIGAEAASTVIFEDSLKNISTCRGMGMGTVFICGDDPEQGVGELGANSNVEQLADVVVDKCSKQQLLTKLPALWQGQP